MGDVTKVHLPDLEDAAPGFGMESVAFRGAREPLGLERSGLSLQRVDAGTRQPFGHRHTEEEEIYVILSGAGTLMAGSEPLPVEALDAVRVAPGVIRAFEAAPAEDLVFLAFGAPGGGRADGEPLPGWWGGEA
jgi:mannose-6-phosphate isomerase-like protein (cupin superfamily)